MALLPVPQPRTPLPLPFAMIAWPDRLELMYPQGPILISPEWKEVHGKEQAGRRVREILADATYRVYNDARGCLLYIRQS